MNLSRTQIRQLIPDLHRSGDRYLQLIEKIENGIIFGSVNSKSSRQLQDIIGLFPELTTVSFKEKLRTVELYGVNLPVCNACAANNEGKRKIIILEGLLLTMKLYSDYTILASVLPQKRPGASFEIDGVIETEVEMLGLAVTSSILHFLETGDGLGNLSDVMGPVLKFRSMAALSGAVTFLIAHELGHLELGHLSNNDMRKESVSIELIISESANGTKDEELQADMYAFHCFAPELQTPNISSILILLSVFSLWETMIGTNADSHPLTVNRMHSFAHLALASASDQEAFLINNVIASEINRYNNLKSFRADYQLRELSSHLSQTMPLEKAITIIKFITGRIKIDHGVIDSDDLAI